MQVTYLLGKGTTILTWFIMLGFVAYNYIGNIQVNHDIRYVTQMFDPFMTLTLSDFSKSSFFLMTYYPLLLVLPTSCAYISDRKSQVDKGTITVEKSLEKDIYNADGSIPIRINGHYQIECFFQNSIQYNDERMKLPVCLFKIFRQSDKKRKLELIACIYSIRKEGL